LRPGKTPWRGSAFLCPECDELLEFKTSLNDYLIFYLSIPAGVVLSYFGGYRGWTFLIVALGLAVLVFLFGIIFHFHISPPEARLRLKNGDTGLRLTGKPRR
jgi:hypothetical protein